MTPRSPLALPAGELHVGDALDVLPHLPPASVQCVIADPPYFRVLEEESWDNAWNDEAAYLEWTENWVTMCRKALRPDGLLFVFGQPGKREHVFLHACSRLTSLMQFHDLVIWDRAVGYNERRDSFTPQYEMILVLRTGPDAKPFFDKDAARVPYDEATIQTYLRDKRYKDLDARERHLRKGKYATNILRIPSLKGASKEKVGHPSQKPIELISTLVAASTRPGDTVLDPFLGSGTTAVAAQRLGRQWIGIERDPAYASLTRDRLSLL